MKNILLAVICLGFMTSGCTAFVAPRSEGVDLFNSTCETVDCLLEEYDAKITNNPASKGRRWKFMEGYKDTPLVTLKAMGKLTIEEISPFWLIPQTATMTWAFGYAQMYPGETGDVHSCTAHYMPIPGWQAILTHELMHCQGYTEGGYFPGALLINAINDSYTDQQEAIMEKEGVSHWYETSVYMNEDATWHDR